MNQNLFIGNHVVKLEKIGSTNSYLKDLLLEKKSLIEGLVIITKDQVSGKGQMGNKWISEVGKNLTFSILLKPRLKVMDQFLISKLISLAMVDFLENNGFQNVSIKWPNDIYINDHKIAGILIENTLKGSIIDSCIVGIGLNVNQLLFEKEIVRATSMKLISGLDYEIDDVLSQLLIFVEKRYLLLKNAKNDKINKDYLFKLYRFNEKWEFEIDGEIVTAIIEGITPSGKLEMKVNGSVSTFDLKEVKFIIQ